MVNRHCVGFMIDRRTFNLSLLMATITSGIAGTSAAKPPPQNDIFLNRLTFGATPTDRESLTDLGRAAWLDDQLGRPASDADLDARLSALTLRINYEKGDDGEGHSWPARDEFLPLSSLNADPATLLPLLDWTVPMAYDERSRPGWEVVAASLPRAVHTPTQTREVMTQFWHDHFNVHSQKSEYTAVFFPSYDKVLREHALGNFRDLLGAVARSPAMLIYLNNDESRASPANENWGRELLELHTLGAGNYLSDRYSHWADVPGATQGAAIGYIDEDVFEVARAFTGWSVGDGRETGEGRNTEKTGRFQYVERWHDPYQKRILGREFPPNRAALADGDDVLDLLATHPGTARFICEKIARRLLSDAPDPALIDRLTQAFMTHSTAPDQIAQVIRALALDPAFDAPPTKLRRPFEFLAALYRASGVEVAAPEAGFHWQLARAGWQQHTYPPPTGHPDRTEDWTTTTVLNRLIDLGLSAHDDWFGCTPTRLDTLVPKRVETCAGLAAYWTTRTHGTNADPLPELFTSIDLDPSAPLPDSAEDRHNLSAGMLAFAALTPQFLFR